jgi:glycosyltransferase involved in cell wall biosynthesis
MINRNGGSYLGRALAGCRAAIESASALEPRIELVIVDNGSSDEPLPTIERELGNVAFAWRVVLEARAGVNWARNAGIAAAKSDLLFFVDSDLGFALDWLRALIAAAASNPAARVFGGRLKLGHVEVPPPRWLAIRGPFARRSIVVECDYGDHTVELPIDDAHGPVGPNMGFRRDIFDQFGVFDTRFGLRPGSLVPGAESEFFDRLARAGMRFLYVADSIVDHPLKQSQMSRRYFRKRLRGIGRATSRLRRIRDDQARQVCGMTLYMWRRLLTSLARWIGAWLTLLPPEERFYMLGDVQFAIGFLQEDFAAWRERPGAVEQRIDDAGLQVTRR